MTCSKTSGLLMSSQVRGAPWYDDALEDSSPAEPREEQLRNEARKLYTMAFEACAMALKGSQEPWISTSCDGVKTVKKVKPNTRGK